MLNNNKQDQNNNKEKMPTSLIINNSPIRITNQYPMIFIGHNLCDYRKYKMFSTIGPLTIGLWVIYCQAV